jgi:hypothetical protein
VVILLFAGGAVWPQPERRGLDAIIWKAMLVVMTGAGWALGVVPAVVAARREGWWVAAVYLCVGAAATALVDYGGGRLAGPLARAGALAAGTGVPLGAGWWLLTILRRASPSG